MFNIKSELIFKWTFCW